MASIFKQKYTVAGNNGKRIRKQSQYWYIDYKAADETRKLSPALQPAYAEVGQFIRNAPVVGAES